MLPLSALLSQILVAFTIELDNAFEPRVPHRTTIAPSVETVRYPWLASLAMWANFLQYVGDGATLREVAERSGLSEKSVADIAERMGNWWRYVRVAPDPADPRPKPPRRDWAARPTAGGTKAAAAWVGLDADIEQRWAARFGAAAVDGLRGALVPVVAGLGPLPAYLPLVGPGFFTGFALPREAPGDKRSERAKGLDEGNVRTRGLDEGNVRAQRLDEDLVRGMPLYALLAKPLFALTLEWEDGAPVSLPLHANVLRVLARDGTVRARDLPRLSGIAKEACATGTAFLVKHGFVALEKDATASAARVLRLTPRGEREYEAGEQRTRAIEERWRERFGPQRMNALRAALETLAAGEPSPLLQCVGAEEGCWRATMPPPETLPHQPTVTHRGGYPDGA